MIFTSFKKLNCAHCGLNTNLRLCTSDTSEQVILCVDYLIDVQEDYFDESEDEEF